VFLQQEVGVQVVQLLGDVGLGDPKRPGRDATILSNDTFNSQESLFWLPLFSSVLALF
jgi:hypothetical protein